GAGFERPKVDGAGHGSAKGGTGLGSASAGTTWTHSPKTTSGFVLVRRPIVGWRGVLKPAPGVGELTAQGGSSQQRDLTAHRPFAQGEREEHDDIDDWDECQQS